MPIDISLKALSSNTAFKAQTRSRKEIRFNTRAIAAFAAAALSLPSVVTPGMTPVAGAETNAPTTEAVSTSAPRTNAIPGVAERIILSPAADASTGMNVTFRTPSAGASVEYRPSGTEQVVSTPTVETGKGDGVHQFAALTDLSPATEYEYRIIGADGNAGPWDSFRTAAADAQHFNFVYFGDAQNGLTEEAKLSAQAAYSAVPDAALAVHTGDQINNADDDEQWGQWFEAQGATARTTPMLTALGNHELMGDPPAKNFQNHFTHPDNGPAALPDSTYFVDYQGVRFITLTSNNLFLGQQAKFLDEALSSNPNQWSVVMFHQPVYNATTKRITTTNLRYFGDILEKHNVDLVLNGHDHAYARGHRTDNEVNGENTGPVYMVSSSGSKFYEAEAENAAWDNNGANRKVWAKETATYAKTSVEGCTMTVNSVITHEGADSYTSNNINGPGQTMDSFTIDKCGESKHVRENL
ncbi:MAG: metallophosphoesterase family protein [Corynebacterium sp.]|uniref:purple acid phosphatase family protein n=1 Tax=Corynebacterium sp. TaxID=1720 RepID=UPI0026DC1EA8|nr:metallophosphoesterase family protein [Corynebacterium sp.]MDO5030060.1 metallophosphoesterase family protein [Corynebacterium sp.]